MNPRIKLSIFMLLALATFSCDTNDIAQDALEIENNATQEIQSKTLGVTIDSEDDWHTTERLQNRFFGSKSRTPYERRQSRHLQSPAPCSPWARSSTIAEKALPALRCLHGFAGCAGCSLPHRRRRQRRFHRFRCFSAAPRFSQHVLLPM